MKIFAKNRGEDRKRKKKRQNSHGIITVFVTLMMVPVVAITGVMVDVSRLKLYSSQAVMAADSYGDGVLSEFDNLLKDLYGLFSVTQNEEGLKAIEDLKKYATYSFKPNGDEKGLTGFMPYKDVDVELLYEKVDGASLSNNNVLMTQISDFMKYRIVEEVLDEAGVLNVLNQFDSMDATMDAMNERNKITNSSKKALSKIDEYYEQLKKLAAYPSYLDGREVAFNVYSAKLKEIVESDEYKEYAYYVQHKNEIKDILEEFEDEEDNENEENSTETTEETEKIEETEETNEAELEKQKIYETYKEYDADEYKKNLKDTLKAYSRSANNQDSNPIDFDNTERVIKTLRKRSQELQVVLQTLSQQIKNLEEKLKECDEETREGIEEEIKDLKEITNYAKDFEETVNLIINNNDIEKNKQNKQVLEDEVKKLDKVKDDLMDGKLEAGKSPWTSKINNALLWYDFRDDKNDFYIMLQKLCEGEEGNKKAGDKEINKANQFQENAEKELGDNEQTAARDITNGLAAQLKSSGASSGNVPKFTDYFSGGLSFAAIGGAGTSLLDRFLVTSYDFGMFSSRVSGVRPEDDEGEGEYADYSLTKVKMSPDVNYLYGAELEYLIGGHNKSVSNLNETRNIICGVRMTMNFTSTYRIKEVNSAIKTIANAAAAASTAAAPLVRAAVSGALRLAFATIETTADWSSLKNRESVIFLKTELGDLQTIEMLEGLLGDLGAVSESSGNSKDKKKIKLSYENYIYVLMCLMVDNNTLLSRTANLITLNRNQAVNSEDTLINLKFKMENTVTAVKATCKIRADFVVVPDNIAKLYYSNTQAGSLIEVLEKQYFGYSVIRGY
ncbi:MAG: DUF5702 domain-containing protein [bacterium]|nr:DUF5702 domain-containing protein [bacterium]